MDVAGKPVRIVESHEEVLVDWAEAALAAGTPLTLVTIDRHLDTASALTASFAEDGGGDDAAEDAHGLAEWQQRVLSRYHDASPEDLELLVERLQNDEHIDAALRLGILDRVLIISSQAGRTGDLPLPRAAVYRPPCAPECDSDPHDAPQCQRRRYDAMLESSLLRSALAQLGFEADAPYVLDIDLDTFSTRKGLEPADAAAFHALIAGAQCVTVAREPEYVNESLDDHDADEIEAAILRHIASAME